MRRLSVGAALFARSGGPLDAESPPHNSLRRVHAPSASPAGRGAGGVGFLRRAPLEKRMVSAGASLRSAASEGGDEAAGTVIARSWWRRAED
jgi:hypothetical protein